MNISTIIVTYNRKELLVKCIEAVLSQTYLPNTIYIIDNASTDGTQELLGQKGLLKDAINGVKIRYELLPKNTGGAGGFYEGIKMAHRDGCDAVWVMDDDGLPEKDCLKNLVRHIDKHDYISPMVISIDDENMMSFEGCTVEEFVKRAEDGVVTGCANPFNGILYSKKLLDSIGYPKKEMFIWGDEINYDNRARKAGLTPIMVLDAIHRHPINRQRYVKYFGNHMMTVPESDWKLFCYVRNRTYNTKMFSGKWNCLCTSYKDFFKFSLYYFFKSHTPKKLGIVFSAIRKGYKEDFTGLENYMK